MANVIVNLTTTGTEDPVASVGSIYWQDGKAYKYVQFKDAVTYVAGHVLTWADATATSVTNDRSGGSSVGNQPAGIALAVMTQNYYGWMLVHGFYSAIVTNGDDDIAAGDQLIVATGTDGACDSSASASIIKIGMAVAADVDGSNTVAGIVNLL